MRKTYLMHRIEIQRFTKMSFLFILAMVFSHYVIYKMTIIPKLPDLKEIPYYLAFGMIGPRLIVIITYGFFLKSWKELLVFSLSIGVLELGFRFLMAILNEPGYKKVAIEVDLQAIQAILLASLMASGLFSIGMVTNKLAEKRT